MKERWKRRIRVASMAVALLGGKVAVDGYHSFNRSVEEKAPVVITLNVAADRFATKPLPIYDFNGGGEVIAEIPREPDPQSGMRELERAKAEMSEIGRSIKGIEKIVFQASAAQTGAQFEKVHMDTHRLADSIESGFPLQMVVGVAMAFGGAWVAGSPRLRKNESTV